MPRLIDADDPQLRKKVYAPSDNAGIEDYPPMIEWADILDAPTIEAEPVRHGKWVRNDLGETYCSECNNRIPYVQCYDSYPDCCMDDEDMQWDEEIERTRVCPHCGAKMDLEDDK